METLMRNPSIVVLALLASILGNTAMAVVVTFVLRARKDERMPVPASDPTPAIREASRRSAILELSKRGIEPATVAAATGATMAQVALVMRMRELEKSRDGAGKTTWAA